MFNMDVLTLVIPFMHVRDLPSFLRVSTQWHSILAHYKAFLWQQFLIGTCKAEQHVLVQEIAQQEAENSAIYCKQRAKLILQKQKALKENKRQQVVYEQAEKKEEKLQQLVQSIVCERVMRHLNDKIFACLQEQQWDVLIAKYLPSKTAFFSDKFPKMKKFLHNYYYKDHSLLYWAAKYHVSVGGIVELLHSGATFITNEHQTVMKFHAMQQMCLTYEITELEQIVPYYVQELLSKGKIVTPQCALIFAAIARDSVPVIQWVLQSKVDHPMYYSIQVAEHDAVNCILNHYQFPVTNSYGRNCFAQAIMTKNSYDTLEYLYSLGMESYDTATAYSHSPFYKMFSDRPLSIIRLALEHIPNHSHILQLSSTACGYEWTSLFGNQQVGPLEDYFAVLELFQKKNYAFIANQYFSPLFYVVANERYPLEQYIPRLERFLVDFKIEMNPLESSSAIFFAISTNRKQVSLQMVEMLLRLGVDPKPATLLSCFPNIAGTKYDGVALARLLLQYGCDPYQVPHYSKQTVPCLQQLLQACLVDFDVALYLQLQPPTYAKEDDEYEYF